MNKIIYYNAGVLVGTVLTGIGAGMQWGLPIGLLSTGGLVLGLTLLAAMLSGREG